MSKLLLPPPTGYAGRDEEYDRFTKSMLDCRPAKSLGDVNPVDRPAVEEFVGKFVESCQAVGSGDPPGEETLRGWALECFGVDPARANRVAAFVLQPNYALRLNYVGRLPDEFADLAELRDLRVAGAGVIGIPGWVPDLPELCRIVWSGEFRSQNHRSGPPALEPRPLTVPADFGECPKLMHLGVRLDRVKSMVTETPGFRELRNLVVMGCPDLVQLPDMSAMRRLRRVRLESLPKVTSLPPGFGSQDNPADYSIHEVPLDPSPENMAPFRNAASVSWICYPFAEVPRWVARESPGLRYINLAGGEVRLIPDEIGDLGDLEVLKLDRCRNLEAIPESVGRLKSLKRLGLMHTEAMDVPPSLGDLVGLDWLSLNWIDLHGRQGDVPDEVWKLAYTGTKFVGIDRTVLSCWEGPPKVRRKELAPDRLFDLLLADIRKADDPGIIAERVWPALVKLFRELRWVDRRSLVGKIHAFMEFISGLGGDHSWKADLLNELLHNRFVEHQFPDHRSGFFFL